MTPRRCDLVVTRWGAVYRGRRYACAVGRGGIGLKSGEGDGVTPIGRFAIESVGFRPDRVTVPPFAGPVWPIGPRDIWSDDPLDPAYNTHRQAARYPFSHEGLRRGDRLYDLVAVLDFNRRPPLPGRGSAIFLHAWRKPRHPTEGCIALTPRTLGHVLASWERWARVVVIGD